VKKQVRGVISVVCVLWCVVPLGAREYRGPLPFASHGYDFDPMTKGEWSGSIDADWYTRSASRAFGQTQGIKTTSLAALFFNQETFRLSNIFEHCNVSENTMLYSPFMRVISITPLVEYAEAGLGLVGEASRRVRKGQGRMGLRVRAPIRRVQTIRTDTPLSRSDQLSMVSRQAVNAVANPGFAYRLDFLEALPTLSFAASQVAYNVSDSSVTAPNTYIKIFNGDTRSGDVAAFYVPEGGNPDPALVGVLVTGITGSTPSVPVNLQSMETGKLYQFGSGAWTPLADAADNSVATRVANQNLKANVWVTGTYRGDYGDVVDGASSTISAQIPPFLNSYTQDVYGWFRAQGFLFDSSTEIGLGDMDVEFFYDHVFGDRMIGGLGFLVRLPTACGSGADETSYAGNPYRSHLGNGHHFEVGGRAHLDAEWRSWAMIRVDAQYLFAIGRSEKVCATPAGSLIKNIGAQTLADVSWHSVVANAELHLCHPQTTDVTGFVGYQFYWKRADTVTYHTSSIESWLGKMYDSSVTDDFTVANSIVLDPALLSAHTEQFAHRVRFGLTYHFSDWFSMSAGAGIVFAGKNMPKEADFSAGCRVAF